jgi:hypothetical protein
MNCHVSPELLWILKSFATLGALVRKLSSVLSDMVFQPTFFCKRQSTLLARISFGIFSMSNNLMLFEGILWLKLWNWKKMNSFFNFILKRIYTNRFRAVFTLDGIRFIIFIRTNISIFYFISLGHVGILYMSFKMWWSSVRFIATYNENLRSV